MMQSAMKSISLAVGLLFAVGCASSNSTSGTFAPSVYYVTVLSANPSTAVPIVASPADNNSSAGGPTSLNLQYNPGTTATLTAPSSTSSGAFVSWAGCDSVSGLVCTVKASSSKTVTAQYAGVTQVAVTPLTPTVVIGSTVQFNATVSGFGKFDPTYTWTLTGPTGYTGGLGDITAAGLYTTPYPAPPTVTVTAISNASPSQTASATLTFTQQKSGAGPALTVDLGTKTRPISPNIYGMNDYGIDPKLPALVNLPIERWGGDAATRYNYLLDATNSAYDYYFENNNGGGSGYPAISQFNTQVQTDQLTKTKTLATVPLIGYTSLRSSACSYSVAKYGAQTVVDPYNADCGTGILKSNGKNIVNDPTDTSYVIDEKFVSGWVGFLDTKFGTAATTGISIYGLDNEPEYWSGVHKDVHPKPFTYDELTNKGISYATAIKAQDPNALVTGPVISNWSNFFYSRADTESGYASAPCYCAQGNPTDRLAHSNTPFIEYYLAQFAKAQASNGGKRLLDYVDLHTYFAAPNAAFALAGNTTLQQARLDSTRVFWDPTYTDPNYTDPSSNTSNAKAFPPQLINLMKGWVSRNYPGTKLAITEYNWGAQESINGAVAQADILGIFGREGLDLGMLWGPPDTVKQVPGVVAFQVYTNYDGSNSHFGETALSSTSANQGQLSVYGAQRASDNAVTIVVINKTYGDLTSTLSLPNLTATGSAKSYLYSAAYLAGMVAQPAVPVVAPTAPSTTSSIAGTFPAQSITLLVIPVK